MIKQDPQLVKNILERGVEEIITREELEKKLKSGKKLRIKLGIDPTSPNIHIGRSIPLLKLRDFQLLGHQIVFIIGDFTGVIGDTSDKDSERPMLNEETIKENIKSYADQASRVIDSSKAEVFYNSHWLGKLSYLEITKQANIFSLNEFISRENISKRLKEGKRVSLRETLYPLMQGYDSVEVRADVEVGGSDQRFNLLTGREMQRHYNQEPQNIITNPLIEGTDGRKMSSSFGNTINLLDTPNDMFGKLMSINDDLIIRYLTMLTRISEETISNYQLEIKSGANPRDIKMLLAKEIVRMYHGEKHSQQAEAYFVDTFSNKNTPQNIPTIRPKSYNIIDVLCESGFTKSKSEARRLLQQGGVKVDGERIISEELSVKPNSTVQKGKINFIKVV